MTPTLGCIFWNLCHLISRPNLSLQLLHLFMSTITIWTLFLSWDHHSVYKVFRKHSSPGNSHSHCETWNPLTGCPVVLVCHDPHHCYGNCKPFPANASKGQPWNWRPSTSHRWPRRSWSHIETDPVHTSQINTLQNKVARHTGTQGGEQMQHFGDRFLLSSKFFS